MLGRSWNYLTGKQLDCFTCASAESCDDVTAAAAAAPVSAITGTSADGGVTPASALQQSDAAKHDLGDDADDAGLGAHPLPLGGPMGERFGHAVCTFQPF